MPSGKHPRPNRPATLADVGREAGVSAMAVSAVLNGAKTSSRIAPETRARILKAATKLQYRPNAAARALAQRRMHTLGVAAVISETGELDHYFLEVFNGVIEAAAHHNQNTTVFTLHDWERDAARVPTFCDGRVDGLILVAPINCGELAKLLPTHTPFVALHANTTLPGVLNLESDEETGAYEMVKHLIALGHRRILHLAGPQSLIGPQRRLAGYKRALTEAKLPLDDTYVVECAFNTISGRTRMREWLDKHSGKSLPHAVFCASDGIAIGCLETLAAAGLRVPHDISVAGFDDSLAARMTMPQLTTVRQPLRAMGIRAVELLLERIKQRHEPVEAPTTGNVVFPTELSHRASVGAASSHRVVIAAR